MKSQQFTNANINYSGCKMDNNGNRCVILDIASGRKFSLQILSFCNGSAVGTGIGKDSPKELNDEVQSLIIKYLSEHGTKSQKQYLRIY